ncbi:MAG: transglycosylase domain-containing protein [Myxococcota bacterium]
MLRFLVLTLAAAMVLPLLFFEGLYVGLMADMGEPRLTCLHPRISDEVARALWVAEGNEGPIPDETEAPWPVLGVVMWPIGRYLVTEGASSRGRAQLASLVAKRMLWSTHRRVSTIHRVALTIWFGRHVTPREQVQQYAANSYFGYGWYGMDTAAHGYFGRAVGELEPHEYALLASIVGAPRARDPWCRSDKAKHRRDHVLRKLHDAGWLDRSTLQHALGQPLGTNIPTPQRCPEDRSLPLAVISDEKHVHFPAA